jgi:hypothetical protein
VGALAIYLEDEGIPTVQVSLVREHTEAIQPPRALWVPFMLGRPLGAPDDPAFQRRVVLAALRLFERNSGPVLEDFPDDAPDGGSAQDMEGAACPISFAPHDSNATVAEKVIDEIAQLRMWHDLGIRRRSRTAVGATRLPLETLARCIAARAEGDPKPRPDEALPDADALRHACEEIKTYYFEARMAQPGSHTSASVRSWFWEETAAAQLLFQLHTAIANDSDAATRDFARNYLIPRAVTHSADKPKRP